MQIYYTLSAGSNNSPIHMAHAHVNPAFLLQIVRNAIDCLQFGKAQDHDGLVGECFIYACES